MNLTWHYVQSLDVWGQVLLLSVETLFHTFCIKQWTKFGTAEARHLKLALITDHDIISEDDAAMV